MTGRTLRQPVRLAGMSVLLAACTVTGPGGLGGTGGFGTGGPVCDEHEPDQVQCPEAPAEPPTGCVVAADCCPGRVPVETGDAPDCPSSSYPNNWTCNSGSCEHGGCSSDSDCILDGFTCESVTGSSVDACVVLCDDDDDCLEANMPGTKCIGQIQGSSDEYCLEDLSA